MPTLMTLGVGRWRGDNFGTLMYELEKFREEYNIPDHAHYVRAPVGSIYAMEVIWITED